MTSSSQTRLVLGVTIAVFLLLPALDLALSGPTAPFHWFAADAFYYHTVARNWVHFGFPTFDQQYPTNGFHPLWQATLAALYGVVESCGGSEGLYLCASILLGLGAIALAIALFASSLVRDDRPLSPIFALWPVGAYGLCVLPGWLLNHDYVNQHEGPLPLYGSLWSYANGMESALALLGYAALLRVLSTPRRRDARVGLAVAGCSLVAVLGRLDHALMIAPVLGYIALAALARRDRGELRSAVTACVAFSAVIAAYLVINRVYAGAFMPVSGSAKSTFPAPKLGWVRWLLFRSPDVFAPGWLDASCRVAQLLIPGLSAVWWLTSTCPGARERRATQLLGALRASPSATQEPRSEGPRAELDRALSLSAIGVILLCGYDFAFVPTGAIGPWYAPGPVAFVSLVLLRTLPSPALSPRLVMAALAASALFCAWVFVTVQRREGYHLEFAQFYLHDARQVLAHYAPERPKLIERDDGIVAFSTGLPCTSGFGFTDDAELARARRNGDLLSFTRARGIRHWASLAYAVSCPRPSPESCLHEDVISAERTFGVEHSRFAIDYRAPLTRFVVVSLSP